MYKEFQHCKKRNITKQRGNAYTGDMAGRVVGCETVWFGTKSCGPPVKSHGGVRQKNTFDM
jgi:hypothetical protein